MILRAFTLFASLSLLQTDAAAQSQLSEQPFAARLFNTTWKLQQVHARNGLVKQSAAVEFRLVISDDGTLRQGLYPEGLVASRWHFDAVRMRLHVIDDVYNTEYGLRVLRMQHDSLLLESYDNGERSLLYYAPIK